jgi:hypothetical protein
MFFRRPILLAMPLSSGLHGVTVRLRPPGELLTFQTKKLITRSCEQFPTPCGAREPGYAAGLGITDRMGRTKE